jgi:hypothetical protein
MRKVVSSAKVEAAQAKNIDGAMSGAHFSELARGDPPFQQG